jgi:indole-3-glycerol phosphate synthase
MSSSPANPSVLQRILAHKRWEVSAQKRLLSAKELHDRVGLVPRPRNFADALRRGATPRVVAEFKRASPSKGAIAPAADVARVTSDYADAGAVALSVLTDTRFFGGNCADLFRTHDAVALPILRKEFIVDAYQIYEARAWGADAVLLLCAALDDAQLADFSALSHELGMTVVVEAHDETECERAAKTPARVIGVNNRDLGTLGVDLGVAARLRHLIPEDRLALFESGVRSPADLRAAMDAGFDAALVGEALMSAPSPGAALRSLLGHSP